MIHRIQVECFDEDGRPIGCWPSILGAVTENDGIPGFSKQVIKNCASCWQRDCEACVYFRKYRRTWKYTEA